MRVDTTDTRLILCFNYLDPVSYLTAVVCLITLSRKHEEEEEIA